MYVTVPLLQVEEWQAIIFALFGTWPFNIPCEIWMLTTMTKLDFLFKSYNSASLKYTDEWNPANSYHLWISFFFNLLILSKSRFIRSKSICNWCWPCIQSTASTPACIPIVKCLRHSTTTTSYVKLTNYIHDKKFDMISWVPLKLAKNHFMV